eukprot:TRINITY_DN2727_c0_g2_i1.p1 TRINITY_DN2727_c0_g2~~TRINITY_DN2727_c0_g2_i1.p1  ORF type:complete len:541 (-),score=178.92 TRINITY_DN2727_c0_g2_i1:259-1644(-)
MNKDEKENQINDTLFDSLSSVSVLTAKAGFQAISSLLSTHAGVWGECAFLQATIEAKKQETNEDVEVMKKLFKKYDKDNSGFLDLNEVKSLMCDFLKDRKTNMQKRVQALFDVVKTKGKQSIDQQIIDKIESNKKIEFFERELERVQKKYLQASLLHVSSLFSISDTLSEYFFSLLDKNGDGKVKENEWNDNFAQALQKIQIWDNEETAFSSSSSSSSLSSSSSSSPSSSSLSSLSSSSLSSSSLSSSSVSIALSSLLSTRLKATKAAIDATYNLYFSQLSPSDLSKEMDEKTIQKIAESEENKYQKDIDQCLVSVFYSSDKNASSTLDKTEVRTLVNSFLSQIYSKTDEMEQSILESTFKVMEAKARLEVKRKGANQQFENEYIQGLKNAFFSEKYTSPHTRRYKATLYKLSLSNDFADSLFEQWDTDHSGNISRTEFLQNFKSIFQCLSKLTGSDKNRL